MVTINGSRPAGPASESLLAEFEKRIGHPLSVEYREFLLRHNGGTPEPNGFSFSLDGVPQEASVMCFFPLRDLSLEKVDDSYEGLKTWPLHSAWADLQHDLEHLYDDESSDRLLPIGTDGSGNYLALVLDGSERGRVVFFDHETAERVWLADDFGRFLETLVPSTTTLPDQSERLRSLQMAKACDDAVEPFRNKDYRKVVQLLEPFEAILSGGPLTKLQIARKRQSS
jgi:hypothetical protein